jgi:hypothetical protein
VTATVVRPGAARRAPHCDQLAGRSCVRRRSGVVEGGRRVDQGAARVGVRRGGLSRLRRRCQCGCQLRDGVTDCRRHAVRRTVGREHVTAAELSQSALRALVTGDNQGDDGDPGRLQPGKRIPIESAQVGREQDRPRGARCRRRQEVSKVDAAADDRDTQLAVLHGRNELRLPARTGDRQHGNCPAGISQAHDSLWGTRTRSIAPR